MTDREERERAVFGPTPSITISTEGNDLMRFIYGKPPREPEARQRYMDTFFIHTATALSGVRRCTTCGSPISDVDPPTVPCSRRCREVLDRAIEAQDDYERAVLWQSLQHIAGGQYHPSPILRPDFPQRVLLWLQETAYRVKAALCLMFGGIVIYDSGAVAGRQGLGVVQWVDDDVDELYTVRTGRGVFVGWFCHVAVEQLTTLDEPDWW